MGACLSTDKLPDNIFIVRNIHDDNRRFPKGIIEVTAIDLKYKDAKSGDEWVWPLKYLRKYGCDRDIFSFEAGRKCPGGEGLYAFSTKKASQLFDMVARNISEGGLLLESEGGALSPPDGGHAPSHSPISLVPSPSPNPPPPPASNPPSHPPAHLPNYQNLNYQNGQPLVGGDLSGGRLSSSPPPALPRDRRTSNSSMTPSPPPAAPALPPRVQYTEVSLPEPSDNSLPLEGKDSEKRVSYSKIDLKQTDEYNQQLAKLQAEAENAHPLPDITNAEFTIITPSDNSKKNGRSREHAHPSSSGSSHRSMSDGNFTSGREAHSKANGSIPGRSYSHSVSTVPDSILYQNIIISKNGAPPIPELPETQQANYINITPQPGLIRKSSEPAPFQNYENLRLGLGMSPPLSSSAMANSSPLATSPPRLIPGRDPMGTYADLDLPKTSTPRGRRSTGDKGARQLEDEEHHVTLNFSSSSSIANKTPAPREGGSGSPQPTEVHLAAAGNSLNEHPENSRPKDECVQYSFMNFEVMEAIRKTKEERKEEIRLRTEEEARAEERRKEEEEKVAKKKAKKQNKKKKSS